MGTACICYKQQQQTKQLITLEQPSLSVNNEQLSSSASGKSKRFMDIHDGQNGQQQVSQLNLNIMNEELARYLVQYQTKNGRITHRFTQRIVQQSENESGLAQLNDKFQKEKENINSCQKQNQLFLPLTNQNAESEISQSNNSQREADEDSNKSCLLSQSSRILNQSLFTQRAQQKQRFYSIFNKLGEAALEKWSDNNRLSYEYEKYQIQGLKNNHFDSKYIACLYSIYQYWQNHFIHLLTYSRYPTGFKIYINGDKKMLQISSNQSQLSLSDVYEGVIQKLKFLDIANLTFILTGWMPQRIYLTQIKNLEGILQRLATNLIQGNTLITFTRQTKLGEQYATLVRIDFENGLIYLNSNNKRNTIPDILLEYKKQQKNQIAIRFQIFAELYDAINLNWNPYIYQLSQTCQGILNEQNKSKKFILVIPSSSQDLQIRLFLQRHQNFMNPCQFGIIINLYEYNGTSDLSNSQPIRTMETDQAIYSDVLIFQYCKDKTQYLLSVQIKQEQQCTQDVYFTLSLYSFAQMKFKTLEQKPCLQKVSIVAKISEENIGFGINSPYFNKNLQFSVQTQVGGQLEIIVNASNNLTYQICLIPDTQGQKILTKSKLENIINKSQISGDKNGKGSFFIKTAFNQYMLMINAYQAKEQLVNIELKYYGKKEICKQDFNLKLDQVLQNQKPFFTYDIKWLPTHFGPRKRLKSNSNNDFQAISVFSQFFKNPIVDKKLIKGTYQFYVKSQTFREYFDSVQSYQDKNACQPPALSMAIFLASQDKKLYKIIFDDAFYVPFGVGFWTSSIQLQEGTYRFILPKIDKGFSKGTFGIIKN